MCDRVKATEAAVAAIAALTREHGQVMFFQSGGCCDGSSPICLEAGELPIGPHDLKLGEVGGAGFYIDSDQYERWNRPVFVLDLAPEPAEGFSLSGPGGTHFVSRTEA
jgi:uncharacterized protein